MLLAEIVRVLILKGYTPICGPGLDKPSDWRRVQYWRRPAKIQAEHYAWSGPVISWVNAAIEVGCDPVAAIEQEQRRERRRHGTVTKS